MKKRILMIIVFIVLFIFVIATDVDAKLLFSTEKEYYFDSIIVTEDKLENGYEYKNSHREFNGSKDITISKIIFNNFNEYLIIGKKSEKPYISYYKDGNLMFEEKNVDCEYGMYIDAIFDENKIIVFGEIRRDRSANKLLIIEYSLNGVSNRKQEIYGDGNSIPKRIFKIKNEYFIVGETLSTELSGCKNPGSRGTFIGKLNKDSFSNYEIVVFGNDKINYVYDVNYINNQIYLLIYFSGVGFFNSGNSSNEFYSLVCFEDRLDMPLYVSLKNEKANDKSKILLKEDEVTLINIIDKYKVEFDTRDIYLNPIKKETYDFYKINEQIENIDAFYENDKIIMNASYNKNNNLYEFRVVLDKNKNKVYNSEILMKEDCSLLATVYRNYIFNTLYYFKKDNQYQLISEMYIKKENEDIYVNGCLLSGKETSVTENEFGDKKTYKEFITNEFNVLITTTTYTPLKVNVQNFSVYDIGLKLEFNAKGYLNGEEIKSGYEIKKCDNYLLELYGSNGNKESIYFIVKDLTITDIKNRENKDYEFSIEKYVHKNSNTNSSVTNEVVSDTIILKNDWYYFLFVFALGIIVASFILKRIERRKNND